MRSPSTMMSTMNTQPSPRKLLLAFSLLAIAYTLLGWYLAAHHVFWFVNVFVLIATLVVTWKQNPLLEFLTWLSQQQVFVLLGMSLVLSLVIALTLTQPVLVTIFPLPLITLFYALLEMRASDLGQTKTFFCSVLITGLGLTLGEVIDLFILPSMRY